MGVIELIANYQHFSDKQVEVVVSGFVGSFLL